ncbi:MAG: hypothetical protein QXX08_10765 [Candidatus Bathyarchaeia archaeon]
MTVILSLFENEVAGPPDGPPGDGVGGSVGLKVKEYVPFSAYSKYRCLGFVVEMYVYDVKLLPFR